MINNDLLEQVVEITHQAGEVILKVYNSSNFDLKTKSDNSPVTHADKEADKLISDKLKQISSFQIISEEGSKTVESEDAFWLVDPLDGTKEFIKKNDEFTVNIGLIMKYKPVLGVVYAPALGVTYYGQVGKGAYRLDSNGKQKKIHSRYTGTIPKVAVSRSHQNEETQEYLKNLGRHNLIRSGSSIKLCLVAEGAASIYPRLGPTSLWDTAAGDAIVRAAGGTVKDPNDKDLIYNKSKLTNPHFIARCKL